MDRRTTVILWIYVRLVFLTKKRLFKIKIHGLRQRFCNTKKTMTEENSNVRPPNTFSSASLLSRLFFLWPYDLIRKGLDSPIEECDLPDVLPEDSSKYNLDIIEKVWEKEKERCRRKSETSQVELRPNLHRALLLHYINTMWDSQVLAGLVCFAQIGQAVTLGYLIQTFSSSTSTAIDSASGYIYASVLVAFALVM